MPYYRQNYPKNLYMKSLYKIITLITLFLFSNNLPAQHGRIAVKQPPRINGVLKATSNAAAKVKIHANSNSVFGTSKTHPKYDKKQSPKGELKDEKVIAKKDKKEKK